MVGLYEVVISDSTHGYIIKKIVNICAHKNLCTNAPGSFIIDKKWKQSKCSVIDKWVNKMWCSHVIEYYSVFDFFHPSLVVSHTDLSPLWLNLFLSILFHFLMQL